MQQKNVPNFLEFQLQVLQFNQVGVHKGTPVTQQSLTSCDFTQQIQRDTYPDAILQVSDSSVPSSFVFCFQKLLVIKSQYL